MTNRTQYIVLREDQDKRWVEYAYNIEAASARGAVAAAARQSVVVVEDGRYVAVPARSWTIRTVKVEMQERLTIS